VAGRLFVAALAGKRLARLVLKDERMIGEERLLTELNVRIRGVAEGPDAARCDDRRQRRQDSAPRPEKVESLAQVKG
jgi:hypothetical protein